MKKQQMSDVFGIMKFLNHAEQLKTTMRQCWASNGKQESTAEHTWRLCLMVMLFEKQLPEINMLKLMKMCLIHDIAEIIDGDIPAIIFVPDKSEKERKNLIILTSPLPEYLKEEILILWDEYEDAISVEAKIAKAMDKLETLMQHNLGENPDDFNYDFNLSYGKKYTDEFPLFTEIRKIVDQATHKKIEMTKKVA
jgi:putative hydrolase of HD superfamily